MEATNLTIQSIRRIQEAIDRFSILPQTPSILQLRKVTTDLRNEYNSLQGFLKDAEKRQEEDEDVRKWISSIKDLAYEAQDITDKHLNPIKRHRRRGNFSCNPWHGVLSIIDAMVLDKDASRIYSLTNKISTLTSNMKAYGIEFTPPLLDPPLATAVDVDLAAEEDESVIVGLDDDVKEIENQLVCTEGAKVIGICGTKGLGKTTLIREVLKRSPLVQEHFEDVFWVYLGYEFQSGDVLRKVFLHLLDKFDHGNLTAEETNTFAGLQGDDFVCELLSQILIEKRCLLIFDDLASADDTFRFALSLIFHSPTHSKVIITTCDASVLNSVHPQAYLHQPKCLTAEQKFLLFQGESAFAGWGIQGQAFRSLKKLIKDKVIALPFPIRLLGGILANDTRYVMRNVVAVAYSRTMFFFVLAVLFIYLSWPGILISLCCCGNAPSLESRLFGEENDEIGIQQVLELSYKALSHRHLKKCLVEMSSHSPEYCNKISTEELYRAWIDKRIVKRRRRSSEQEVAEGYLNELVKRSLVQVVEKDRITGKTRSCQLHSLVREFYRGKATTDSRLTRGRNSIFRCFRNWLAEQTSRSSSQEPPLEGVSSISTGV